MLPSRSYTETKIFLSHTALPVSRLGVHSKLWGDTTKTNDLSCPEGYPTPCSAIKDGGNKEEMGTLGIITFVFPNNSYVWWSPTFFEMAEPDDGK